MNHTDKKEYFVIKCNKCNELRIFNPKNNRKSNRYIAKCFKCNNQFPLDLYNKVKYHNPKSKVFKNAEIFNFLVEISQPLNNAKKLKDKFGEYFFRKYKKFTIDNKIIIYDIEKHSEISSVFKINFFHILTTYYCRIDLSKEKIKKRNINDKLNCEVKLNYKRLNQQIKVKVSEKNNHYQLETFLVLPDKPYWLKNSILKKITELTVKKLKDEKLIFSCQLCLKPKIRILKYVADNYIYEFFKGFCIDNVIIRSDEKLEFLNSYRLFKFMEVGEADRGIHRFIIVIREIDIISYDWIYNIFKKLRDCIKDNYIRDDYYSRYFNLSQNNTRNIRIDICDKYKNGLSNIELFNKGILEFRLFLRECGFNEMEVELVIFLINMNIKNIEYGLRITSPETLILNNFKTHPHTYKVIGGKYWIDHSDGFELDITGSFSTVFLYAYHLKYDFLTIYGQLFNQFSNSNQNLAIINKNKRS